MIASDDGGATIEALRRLCGLGDPVYDNEGVCRRAGADRDVADRLWRALGFPDVPEGEIAFTEDDARALELATEGLANLPSQSRDAALELAVHEARIVSSHLAGLAETELDAIGAMAPLGFRRELVEEALAASGLDVRSKACLRLAPALRASRAVSPCGALHCLLSRHLRFGSAAWNACGLS